MQDSNSLTNADLFHISVNEKYSSIGIYANKLLTIQMINELKNSIYDKRYKK